MGHGANDGSTARQRLAAGAPAAAGDVVAQVTLDLGLDLARDGVGGLVALLGGEAHVVQDVELDVGGVATLDAMRDALLGTALRRGKADCGQAGILGRGPNACEVGLEVLLDNPFDVATLAVDEHDEEAREQQR